MNNGKPSWWTVLCFKLTTWLACVVRGQLQKYPMLVAQAKLESGSLTNTYATKANNPWSMRMASQRKQQGVTGELNGFAVYRTLWDAISDRLAWDKYWDIPYEGDELYADSVLRYYIGLEPDPADVDQYRASWLELRKQGDDTWPDQAKAVSVFAWTMLALGLAALAYAIYRRKRAR